MKFSPHTSPHHREPSFTWILNRDKVCLRCSASASFLPLHRWSLLFPVPAGILAPGIVPGCFEVPTLAFLPPWASFVMFIKTALTCFLGESARRHRALQRQWRWQWKHEPSCTLIKKNALCKPQSGRGRGARLWERYLGPTWPPEHPCNWTRPDSCSTRQCQGGVSRRWTLGGWGGVPPQLH